MSNHRVSAALLASAALLLPFSAFGQPAAGGAPEGSPPSANQAPAAPSNARLTEGEEVNFALDDALSSATSAEGDKFSITTTSPLKLADGTVIPAGYHGRGEVSSVEKRGMMGKAGQLSVRLEYVMIGDTKVPLRASKSQEGKSNQTTTIVLSLLVTPLFLLMHGKDATIPKGQAIVGYVDTNVEVATPVAPPPVRN